MRGRALGRGSIRKKTNSNGKTVYVGDWMDAHGKRRRKQLGGDRRVAERALAEIIRKRDLEIQGLHKEQGLDRNVEELKEQYLADLRQRASEAHVNRCTTCIEKIVIETRAHTVQDVRKDSVARYRDRRLKEGASNRTVNLEVTSLSAMLNWAVRRDLLATNPLAGLERLPQGKAHEKKPRRELSLEEARKLVAASRTADERKAAWQAAERTIAGGTKGPTYAERERKPYVPQTPLWVALMKTGARWGELTNVTWGAVRLDDKTLTIRAKTAKSRHQRNIPLDEELAEELQDLQQVHEELLGRPVQAGDLVFLTPLGESWQGNRNNALRMLHELLGEAGIDKHDTQGQSVCLHSMRYTFAYLLAKGRVPVIETQKLMDHSDPKLTTDIYTKLGVTELRQAIESMPRLNCEQESDPS